MDKILLELSVIFKKIVPEKNNRALAHIICALQQSCIDRALLAKILKENGLTHTDGMQIGFVLIWLYVKTVLEDNLLDGLKVVHINYLKILFKIGTGDFIKWQETELQAFFIGCTRILQNLEQQAEMLQAIFDLTANQYSFLVQAALKQQPGRVYMRLSTIQQEGMP